MEVKYGMLENNECQCNRVKLFWPLVITVSTFKWKNTELLTLYIEYDIGFNLQNLKGTTVKFHYYDKSLNYELIKQD